MGQFPRQVFSEKRRDLRMQPILREDLLRYRFFSALAAAPDGSSAVFCLSQAREEENDYHKQLWVYPPRLR